MNSIITTIFRDSIFIFYPRKHKYNPVITFRDIKTGLGLDGINLFYPMPAEIFKRRNFVTTYVNLLKLRVAESRTKNDFQASRGYNIS